MGPVAAQMTMTRTAPMNPAVDPAKCVTNVAKRDGKLPRTCMCRSISFSLSDDSKGPRGRGSGGILMAVSHLRERNGHHGHSDTGNSCNDSGGFGAIDFGG